MTTESWVINAPQNIDVDEVRRVVVQLNAGSLDVVADPARTSGAHVEVAEISERPLQVSAHDGDLRIGYDFSGFEGIVERAKGMRDKDSATVRLTVPVDVALKLSTSVAATTATGTRGALTVATATGPVRVQGSSGAVSVKTASASVDVLEHLGDVRVSTGSGAVNLVGTLGRASVSTVSSNVEIVAREQTPLVEAKTVSGDVAVRLGPETPVNIRARSVNGKVVLDGAPLESSAQRSTKVDHVDPRGAAAAYVSARTVSGDVTVSRG
ncbi:DUF4097 family beta strand repeat-containing protein [Cellulosimicrobium arenosum]|uniref:DUF4097 family beta strand repeat protein n=1 Tax=Cellulosimicrobium arenosum TaxID=2708133 RepID=A0A927J2L1_9MICO|nr:DUF4097 family beta strand repeat-containing protein [Cellulosimicrobium arenosum]MBD8080698.1 DUF4097 family beta strand repeat protein [Cellulosimicrobium arenosum]